MKDIRKELVSNGWLQIEKDNNIRDVYQKEENIVTVVKKQNVIEWRFEDEEFIK